MITSHPDHVRSLFTAKPEQAPSLTGESPLRPIVGPNSVLTAVGPRHMRQRKLLLPPFHGEAIEQYTQMIADAAEREIDRWPRRPPLRPGAAHAGDHARRDHGRDLRHRGQARARHARALAAHRDQAHRRRLDLAAGAGQRTDQPQPRRAGRPDAGRSGAARPPDLRGDRAAAPRRRPGRAARHPLAAAAGAHRGRRGAERQRTARRAAHAGPRRARDDGQLAGLDLGAAGPQPRRPRRACATRSAARATPPSRSRRRSSRGCARAR